MNFKEIIDVANGVYIAGLETRIAELKEQIAVWRLIDTAPTDGRYIMLGNKNGSWVGRYNPVYQSGYRPKNPWQSMMLNHDHMRVRELTPTHWMPMPSAPSLRGSERG